MKHASERGERKIVLLVDDDPMATELFGEILAETCDIRMANSVDEAMQIINTEPLAGVISDFHLGRECADTFFLWIQAEHPQLARRFMLLTGDKVADLSLFEEQATVLFKPVHIKTLLDTVTQMLDYPQESVQ